MITPKYDNLAYQISVMQAKLDGKEIQCCHRGLAKANDIPWTAFPTTTWVNYQCREFDWNAFMYRIKPQPIEGWVHPTSINKSKPEAPEPWVHIREIE